MELDDFLLHCPVDPKTLANKLGRLLRTDSKFRKLVDHRAPHFAAHKQMIWRSYIKAKEWANNKNFKCSSDFVNYPPPCDIPKQPYRIYDEWEGWEEFLGSKWVPMPFADAQEIIKKHKIRSKSNYRKKYKRYGLPSNPNLAYSSEWVGWGKFLGTGRLPDRAPAGGWPNLETAKEIIHNNGMSTQPEYKKACRRLGLPSNPNTVYKEWRGFTDFFGTAKRWRSFTEAREYARTLQLNLQKWVSFCKASRAGRIKNPKPADVPSNPCEVYRKEWISWADFLGSQKEWPSYDEARRMIQKAKIASGPMYHKWAREAGLPATPHKVYRKEWCGWRPFLYQPPNADDFLRECPMDPNLLLVHLDQKNELKKMVLAKRPEWASQLKKRI